MLTFRRRSYSDIATAATGTGAVRGLTSSREAAQEKHNGRQQTTAFTGSSNLGPPNAAMTNLVTGVNLIPMLWDVLPDTMDQYAFPSIVMQVYRDIYFFDSVAGATIDLLSQLPFSGWTLQGMDKAKLVPYQESLERLDIQQYMPELTADYLIYGAHLATTLWSSKRKIFSDVVPLLPEFGEFTPMPIRGQDPIIEYTVPQHMKGWLKKGKSKRVEETLTRMGKLGEKMKSGKFELDPLTTLFVPRCTTNGRLGTSFLKRILPIYLVEKNLWKGTMIESTRRIRSIMHLTVGETDAWEPQPNQIDEIAQLFLTADADPLGAVVATRNGVQVNEVRQGGDFWNIFNIWGDTVPAKLRALGISESFLSGDSSYNTMETSLSVFIDNLKAFRHELTNKVFSSRIFPIISLAHGHVRSGEKLPAEILRAIKAGKRGEQINPETILRGIQDTRALEIPELVWTKTLEPKGDQQYMDLLNTLTEKGVPVPIRAIAAAGGYNIDEILEGFQDDFQVRRKIAEFKKQLGVIDKEFAPDEPKAEEFQGEFSAERNRILKIRRQHKLPAVLGGSKQMVGLARNYGDLSEIRQQSKTGKFRLVVDQKAANARVNKTIAKVATRMNEEERRRARRKKNR